MTIKDTITHEKTKAILRMFLPKEQPSIRLKHYTDEMKVFNEFIDTGHSIEDALTLTFLKGYALPVLVESCLEHVEVSNQHKREKFETSPFSEMFHYGMSSLNKTKLPVMYKEADPYKISSSQKSDEIGFFMYCVTMMSLRFEVSLNNDIFWSNRACDFLKSTLLFPEISDILKGDNVINELIKFEKSVRLDVSSLSPYQKRALDSLKEINNSPDKIYTSMISTAISLIYLCMPSLSEEQSKTREIDDIFNLL
jgi:hypothetical protein